ncbi:hypothetical protein AWE51_14930 [Aquimarina aggregata]|uniref:Guanylate cyclase domain-containing protein n=1 Tax=Aquimarina aggregata TaxID=1642818 RepID=A0A162Y138_9FLAO|nr:DUF2652 domain-containing protein [Aquimarina aggregata]KZS38872.1 hypothetical protein AWE51_14930 [Aquimarina aggregata]
MEATPTLLCIPDISGFTQFMSTTNIELSAKVIPSLLNRVIYANKLDLKVSEIEGDAILFYKTGPLPTFAELVYQCRLFYTEFYDQLKILHKQYKNHNEGINIPEILGLKIVLHYGQEISAVPIGKNIKLMGEDVIIAHRLLKNKIPIDEYILLSEDLLSEFRDETIDRNFGWGELHDRETKYKHIGEINYSYINLEPLVE